MIDFILGKSSKDITLPPQGDGYTDFYLEIRDGDNVAYTLHRKNGENEINVKKASLKDYDSVLDTEKYSSSSRAAQPISMYLLQLSKIHDVYLKNGSTKSLLYYSHIRHLFMVDEERMVTEKNSSLFLNLTMLFVSFIKVLFRIWSQVLMIKNTNRRKRLLLEKPD